MLIPILNLFIGIWLILAAGTMGMNKYGAMPAENPIWVKIVGFAIPVIMVLGIIAAVALPAYQDYLLRAG